MKTAAEEIFAAETNAAEKIAALHVRRTMLSLRKKFLERCLRQVFVNHFLRSSLSSSSHIPLSLMSSSSSTRASSPSIASRSILRVFRRFCRGRRRSIQHLQLRCCFVLPRESILSRLIRCRHRRRRFLGKLPRWTKDQQAHCPFSTQIANEHRFLKSIELGCIVAVKWWQFHGPIPSALAAKCSLIALVRSEGVKCNCRNSVRWSAIPVAPM